MSKKKQTPLMVRLPEDLHAWVKELAEKEHRSLNSQIIVLLQQAKDQQSQPVERWMR